MSLGKLPALKSWVSNSHSKRRYKSELTVDMISPPLGDFRHTMHVGRGGDVFGDTSFLSNHGGSEPEPDPKSGGFFSRTFRQVRKPNFGSRARGGSRELSPSPPPVSPIIKNAVSLPQLAGAGACTPNGSLRRALFQSTPASPQDVSHSYGVESGFCTLPRLSRLEKQPSQNSDYPDPEFQDSHRSCTPEYQEEGSLLLRSDSMTSFTLDLGPSLMSEVMGLFGGPCDIFGANQSSEGRSDSPTSSPAPLRGTEPRDAPLRAERSAWQNGDAHSEEEEDLKRATPEEAGPTGKDPAIEAERFQKAASVLSRHYGGPGPLTGEPEDSDEESDADLETTPKRAPFAYPEEDEIKV
ncbi:cdc42 effector protein 1-like [Acipenser ruthenus]|uniref:cdc42 effector protein 1-like n=1 Tax=Acipenser ruthenus TaxID=7906 RepID=UPI0027412407|nr:cdc42 effector protein 1-like [Acipenser ruthenus]XP_058872440.1 cdc42 effector protein 1-like [Acipenser ruthenus]XP_058872441.1 cdc42 effector protein 1-like [Acipenser ruthenus]